MARYTKDQTRIATRLEQWARIRTGAGLDAEIPSDAPESLGREFLGSALLQRLIGEGKDPLPLPPPRFLGRPWYPVIEEACALIERDLVVVSRGTVAIGEDDGWRLLRTVIPGISFDVTYPGRAIGRWSLTLQGSSDGATWRLVRETVGPGAGWENHVARVTRRLRRFLADPERCEFVIVDSPDGYVQVCTLEHDTALRYEAAGELNLARAAAIAPGLSDRLRALGFDGPDDEAEGNYFRVGPAPVDARALAQDMLIVLAEAYGLRPEDRITAIDAAMSVDGKGTRRLLPVHLGAASAGARIPAVIDRDDESPSTRRTTGGRT